MQDLPAAVSSGSDTDNDPVAVAAAVAEALRALAANAARKANAKAKAAAEAQAAAQVKVAAEMAAAEAKDHSKWIAERAETERLRKTMREQKRIRFLHFLEEAQSYGVHNLYFGMQQIHV